ncbi:aspartate 1-decarboxylase [Bacillus subtilis]|uniref:Aspartate 1-decarboxylase n=1 Tax=Bacillus subtilis TaxID=1423 RepID=A0A8I1WHV1_BACIU|nr:aspartate 1-decarboxylase [Bacillus subtilis]MBO3797177.1 aspartate 1-decarboxylase [Bacillus subtilis]
MYLNLMKSKLHRAIVTEANLNYVGSITIDEHLMGLTGILANEKVQIVNINTGARMETYVIPGEKDSGKICLNGAAARLVQPGDKVIIISYALMTEEEAKKHSPIVAVMNEENKVVQLIKEKENSTI